jgi:hypothetical protein
MLRTLRQRTGKGTMSPSSQPGSSEQPAGPGRRELGRCAKRRFLAPFARFFGWWAGMFAFLAAFSVCPFCGQPGCAGGPAFAAALGGISAFFLSVLRPGLRRQKAPRCGILHDQDCAASTQLNIVTRPPVDGSATGVSRDPLAQSSRVFGPPAKIAGDHRHVHEHTQFSASPDAILGLLRKRPCSMDGITQGLGVHPNEVVKYIGALQAANLIKTRWTSGMCYYEVTDENRRVDRE